VNNYMIFPVSEYFAKNEKCKVEELSNLLDFLSVNLTIERIPESDDYHLIISYDVEKIKKAQTRNAGRRKSYKALQKNITYGEVKQLLQEHTAEEVSRMLDMSRRTLYRRLKDYGDDPMYHQDSDTFF
jgi:DNA-binding NtrC family response regulator